MENIYLNKDCKCMKCKLTRISVDFAKMAFNICPTNKELSDKFAALSLESLKLVDECPVMESEL